MHLKCSIIQQAGRHPMCQSAAHKATWHHVTLTTHSRPLQHSHSSSPEEGADLAAQAAIVTAAGEAVTDMGAVRAEVLADTAGPRRRGCSRRHGAAGAGGRRAGRPLGEGGQAYQWQLRLRLSCLPRGWRGDAGRSGDRRRGDGPSCHNLEGRWAPVTGDVAEGSHEWLCACTVGQLQQQGAGCFGQCRGLDCLDEALWAAQCNWAACVLRTAGQRVHCRAAYGPRSSSGLHYSHLLGTGVVGAWWWDINTVVAWGWGCLWAWRL